MRASLDATPPRSWPSCRRSTRTLAETWVDAQLDCGDFVEASTRAQQRVTKGKIDAEAYADCLRGELSEEQMRDALVATMQSEFGDPAVAALARHRTPVPGRRRRPTILTRSAWDLPQLVQMPWTRGLVGVLTSKVGHETTSSGGGLLADRRPCSVHPDHPRQVHAPEELQRPRRTWRDEIGAGRHGWLGGTYGFTDDDMFVGVVRFESREAAMANSERPEQGAWAEQMMALMDGPVEFHDCDDVTLMLDGGSDRAGFVQVIRGKVAEPDRLKALMTDTDMLHEMRPDILGRHAGDRGRRHVHRDHRLHQRGRGPRGREEGDAGHAGRGPRDPGDGDEGRDLLRPAPPLVRVAIAATR